MKAFARLLAEIEQTNSTNEKVDLMARYFRAQDADTSVWSLYFLSGQRPKKFIGSGKLRAWAEELAKLPSWLVDECYGAVGDTAEMVSLIVAPYRVETADGAVTSVNDVPLREWMVERLEPLAREEEPVQKERITAWWRVLSTRETFVLNKLMTGGLRIGVSETLVYRAISQAFELPRTVVAARLLGNWRPTADFFAGLIRPAESGEDATLADGRAAEALPVPFCLAAPLEDVPSSLGSIDDWQIEWKWDGIRGQIVKSGDRLEIWSRGEERATEAFPDLVEFFGAIPGDFTIDGEILAGSAAAARDAADAESVARPGSFNDLQRRLNRKNPGAALLKANPVCFFAYDFLRDGDEALSELPLAERRARLENKFSPYLGDRLGFSPVLRPETWEGAADLQRGSRARNAEGLMLKRRSAPYATGRKRGIWFKWKVDPLTLDVVLTAAQPGTGRRASLYTDYTFGIWKGDQLVPIAKAYSGLTDEEIRELDGWIRRNTVDRFGPVRTLKPERVFEIGFEGIGASSRHKSGYAVRFPRILRERTDKPVGEADRVETVEALLRSLGAGTAAAESSTEVSP